MTRRYETVYIFDSALEEPAINEKLGRFHSLLGQNDQAPTVDVHHWGKRTLTYPIKKRDTEEYDRHVILHEWAHYLEDRFSRSDSIGGPHARNDRVDMRVAFGEGWATAFAGLATGDSIYRDTQGPNQANAGGFNIEGPSFIEPANAAPGWYSEQSVQEIVYDLVDTADDGADTISLAFGALFYVLTDAVPDSVALTSIFPFIDALTANNPGEAALIGALLADQSISTDADEYGAGEDNDANSSDVLPIYTPLSVGGPAVNVCSTDEFESGITGLENKLSTRRFLRFSLPATALVTLTATATDVPADEFSDPDFVLHSRGPLLISNDAPTAACEDASDPGWAPGDCFESYSTPTTQPLAPGDYVLEVYEWTNTQSADDEFPPIGRTCFDVTVTTP
jgi:ribosomal protein S6